MSWKQILLLQATRAAQKQVGQLKWQVKQPGVSRRVIDWSHLRSSPVTFIFVTLARRQEVGKPSHWDGTGSLLTLTCPKALKNAILHARAHTCNINPSLGVLLMAAVQNWAIRQWGPIFLGESPLIMTEPVSTVTGVKYLNLSIAKWP